MKKKSSRLGSVVLCLCLALVCLIAGIALVLLPALLPDAFPRYDIWAYASIAPFAVSLILLIASFILLKKGLKEQKKESEEFLEELKKAEEGEKGVLNEDSFYYGEAARHINESVLLQPYEKQPFGVYEGREYDDLILNNLRNEISVSAGVAYFAFNIEPKLVRSGPREALLVMLKENFGKNVYYGRLQNGIMVFVPVLSSREEFKGKARRCVQLYSYTDGDLHIGVKAGVAFYPDFTPENLTSASLKETMNLDLLQSIEQDKSRLGCSTSFRRADLYINGYRSRCDVNTRRYFIPVFLNCQDIINRWLVDYILFFHLIFRIFINELEHDVSELRIKLGS